MESQQNLNNIPEYTFTRIKNGDISNNPNQNSILENDLGAIEEVTLDNSSDIKNNNPEIEVFNHNEENNNYICDSSSEENSDNENSIKVSQIQKKENGSTIKDFAKEFINLENNNYLELVEPNEIEDDIFQKITLEEMNNLKEAKNDVEKMENKQRLIYNIDNKLDNLISKELIIKNNILNNENIFAYRKILNDNDSFFRSIIFSTLEDIILNRKKNMFRFFIYELYKNIGINHFQNIVQYYKLDSNKVKLYLILIYTILFSEEKTSIEKAYLSFIKIYNSEKNFEPILILNLKFQIYKYLTKSENKIYSQENKIKIGNLLPSQYKSNEKFDFKKFYENNLFPLKQPIEDITKLVMPFILMKNLMIYNIKNNEINYKLITVGKKGNNMDNLYLLCLNENYFIIYSKKYFQNFDYIFNNNFAVNLNNMQKKNKVVNMVNNIASIDEKDKSQRPIDEISAFIKKDTTFKHCEGQVKTTNNNDKNEKSKNSDYNINNNININSNNDNLNYMKNSPNYNNNNNQNSNNQNNIMTKENNYINNDINTNNNNNNIKSKTYNTNLNLNQNNKQHLQGNENAKIAIPKNQLTDFTPNVNNDKLKELCYKCKTLGKNELYCDKCIYEVLITNTKHSYSNFIKNNIENPKKEKYSTNRIIYFPNKDKKKFSEVFNFMPDTYKHNFIAKLSEIKSSLCLGCLNYIEDKTEFIQNQKGEGLTIKNTFMFKFPCRCIICSEKCLNKYITKICIKKMPSYVCACGEEYDNVKLKYLLYFALSHNLNEFKKELLRIINDYMKIRCCICSKIQEKKKNINIIEIEDKEIEMIFKINKFKHLVCDACVKSIDNSKNFIFCDLCSSKHTILNKKNISSEFKNNCIII